MNDARETRKRTYWSTASELSQEAFAAWCKPDAAISPVAIVATIDPDGAPRTALFGSLRAVTPRVLRLCTVRDHDTFANLCRDGRVMVSLVSPPDVAVSVRGRARVVKEWMAHDEHFAIVEIDVEEVKNDMAYRVIIEGTITISAKERFKPWYDAAMREVESLQSPL